MLAAEPGSAPDSGVRVVPTNEELMIAQHTLALIIHWRSLYTGARSALAGLWQRDKTRLGPGERQKEHRLWNPKPRRP
jgi:hypothetical protein